MRFPGRVFAAGSNRASRVSRFYREGKCATEKGEEQEEEGRKRRGKVRNAWLGRGPARVRGKGWHKR